MNRSRRILGPRSMLNQQQGVLSWLQQEKTLLAKQINQAPLIKIVPGLITPSLATRRAKNSVKGAAEAVFKADACDAAKNRLITKKPTVTSYRKTVRGFLLAPHLFTENIRQDSLALSYLLQILTQLHAHMNRAPGRSNMLLAIRFKQPK